MREQRIWQRVHTNQHKIKTAYKSPVKWAEVCQLSKSNTENCVYKQYFPFMGRCLSVCLFHVFSLFCCFVRASIRSHRDTFLLFFWWQGLQLNWKSILAVYCISYCRVLHRATAKLKIPINVSKCICWRIISHYHVGNLHFCSALIWCAQPVRSNERFG